MTHYRDESSSLKMQNQLSGGAPVHSEPGACTVVDPPSPLSLSPPRRLSLSQPQHPTTAVENLLNLIRQLRDGTYDSPAEDIIIPLTSDEYDAFETAIKADTGLHGWVYDKLRCSWLATTCQLIIKMATIPHETWINISMDALKDATTQTIQELPETSVAHDLFRTLNFNGGGGVTRPGPRTKGKLCPDRSIYSNINASWCPCVVSETAYSQQLDSIEDKVKHWVTMYEGNINTIIVWKLHYGPPQSKKAMYQIYRVRKYEEQGRVRVDVQPTPLTSFRSSDGQVEPGAFRLKLSDLCPAGALELDSADNVEISIPHSTLAGLLTEVEAIREKDEQLKEPSNRRIKYSFLPPSTT
ncbi:hypothetical protein BU26DRAFT_514217 [Trematosphaeria pertusa]|uniref:Uncharacterized protein n=1 Tax=Trematosphaeria pertusa TaxID=390896 RepID=A0A6A6IUX3_9PLEO|nr:uncharacterized protein BU26DRAFT_514217 [Trematosphaeria pertusa]KAF2254244.1 hypothetical protein BU26DRAFT_514217 [Trematosphaeria pertusa]